jgi:hypothetical protein
LTPLRHLDGLLPDPDAVVGYIYGLPLTHAEAGAVSSWMANVLTPREHQTLNAWLVKMTLIHGLWVEEMLPMFKLETSP